MGSETAGPSQSVASGTASSSVAIPRSLGHGTVAIP